MRSVAILVDGAFYLKRHKKYFGNKEIKDVKDVVKDLQTHCLKHINKKAPERERLYRIFFYDCPPLSIKQHHPLTNKSIDFSKTDIFTFRNNLHNKLKQTRQYSNKTWLS